MEGQDLHPSEAPDEDDGISGVVPTVSVANSGPEVDVRLAESDEKSFADILVEQR